MTNNLTPLQVAELKRAVKANEDSLASGFILQSFILQSDEEEDETEIEQMCDLTTDEKVSSYIPIRALQYSQPVARGICGETDCPNDWNAIDLYFVYIGDKEDDSLVCKECQERISEELKEMYDEMEINRH